MIASDSYRDYDVPSFFSQLFVRFDVCVAGPRRYGPSPYPDAIRGISLYDRTLRSQVPLSTSLCICISVKRRTTRKKNSEGGGRSGKKNYTSVKTYIYCISRMKRHGGARGKGPTSIHRASCALCSYYKNSHRNVGTAKTKTATSVIIITKATGAIKRSRLKYTSAIKRIGPRGPMAASLHI